MIQIWQTTKAITPELYLNDAMPPMQMVLALSFLTLAIAFLALILSLKNRLEKKMVLLLAISLQSVQYFYYCIYSDEVYVNLEHSWNLYHFGKFSFSPLQMIDGTVELFYYWILSPFAWSHESLIHACILLGWLITILHTVVFWYMLRKTNFFLQTLLTIAFAWNPIFAEIQGAGFGNGLISLFYFIGIAAILEEKTKITSLCAAVLPLFRPDAVVYSLFLIIAITIKQRKIPFLTILLVALSSIIYLGICQLLYGHWVLTPILYKKTPYIELIKRINNQIEISVYGLFDSYTMSVMLLLVLSNLGGLVSLRPEISAAIRNVIRSQMFLLVLLYFFYNFTNRNFFAETRRYYLPLEYLGFLFVFTEWGFIHQFGKSFSLLEGLFGSENINYPLKTRSLIILSIVAFNIIMLNYTVQRWHKRNFRFQDRNSKIHLASLLREDSFSVMAKITKELVPQNWRIATTELQGFGFLLDYEIDPLFGYANRKIATSTKLTSMGIKIDPDYLFESKPEVVWNGQIKHFEYPTITLPENRSNLFDFLNTWGIDPNRLLKEYRCFILQGKTERNVVENTVLLIRNDRITTFEESLKLNGYIKFVEFPFSD
jgi:hypothetical protein